ncbi:MAG: hypothetical protein H5U38_13930 [Calditrichaeota bacterium]|nr:hypothetical protein [Calditrichota bacterium]
MEYKSAEDFRQAAEKWIASYYQQGVRSEEKVTDGIRTRGGVTPNLATSMLCCMTYLLGVAYYSLRLYRDKQKAKSEALAALKKVAPKDGCADCEKHLETALSLLSATSRSGAVEPETLVQAVYPIWKDLFPHDTSREKGLLRYVLKHALGPEEFGPNGGAGPLPLDEKA